LLGYTIFCMEFNLVSLLLLIVSFTAKFSSCSLSHWSQLTHSKIHIRFGFHFSPILAEQKLKRFVLQNKWTALMTVHSAVSEIDIQRPTTIQSKEVTLIDVCSDRVVNIKDFLFQLQQTPNVKISSARSNSSNTKILQKFLSSCLFTKQFLETQSSFTNKNELFIAYVDCIVTLLNLGVNSHTVSSQLMDSFLSSTSLIDDCYSDKQDSYLRFRRKKLHKLIGMLCKVGLSWKHLSLRTRELLLTPQLPITGEELSFSLFLLGQLNPFDNKINNFNNKDFKNYYNNDTKSTQYLMTAFEQSLLSPLSITTDELIRALQGSARIGILPTQLPRVLFASNSPLIEIATNRPNSIPSILQSLAIMKVNRTNMGFFRSIF